MKKKRSHSEVADEAAPCEAADHHLQANNTVPEVLNGAEPAQQELTRHKSKKAKKVYSRVNVDPTKNYSTPESRESWGPNVKGKKFRKEKGKKKRTAACGVKIDGAVKSIRFD